MFDSATGSQGMYDTFFECPICKKIRKFWDSYCDLPEGDFNIECCNTEFIVDFWNGRNIEPDKKKKALENIMKFGEGLCFGVNFIYYCEYKFTKL